MSRVFLDTSAYSAFKRDHPQIRHRIREASEIQLNSVVLGELRAGFLKGTRLRDNLAELAQFLASPRVTVFVVDEETAERYAVILDSLRQAGTPIPTNDVWIAAGAMRLGPADNRPSLPCRYPRRDGDLRALSGQAKAGET